VEFTFECSHCLCTFGLNKARIETIHSDAARWTLPRRKLALAVFQEAVTQGDLRSDIDLEATIDLLYAPMYYRLQMGTGPLSDVYIDEIFDQVMEGLLQRQDRTQKDRKR
jgi:Tetracyclin repressor-like, C-terminal domain